MSRRALSHRALSAQVEDLFPGILALPNVREEIAGILARRAGGNPRSHGPLQPEVALWLCLAMALYRARSIPDVFARLLGTWRDRLPGIGLRDVTDGALAHARERLGPGPLVELFNALARDIVCEPSFHGLCVWALDCTYVSMPDTPANDVGYGRQKAVGGVAAFPQAMAPTLVSTRTHEVRAACLLPFSAPETWATLDLVKCLGERDLVLMDRNLSGAWYLRQFVNQRVSFVARIANFRIPTITAHHAPGDCDVLVKPTHADPLRPDKSPFALRMIEYRIGGREAIRLLTNLPRETVPAREIAELYHERWDAELSYDELKTHLLATAQGGLKTTFRGRSPQMVDQEFYAALCLFNLVRRLLGTAAARRGLAPRRLSFVSALHVIGDAMDDVERAPAAARLRLFQRILDDLADCALDRWRRSRVCPRAVRRKTVHWERKQPGQRCRNVPEPSARLRMGARG